MTNYLPFREALSVLSKSSPYAVSTERENSISNRLDDIKKYLYIETDIENDFHQELANLNPNDKKIIFLCGSSGDGKSEILTKYSKQFSTRADFHLDATHSFKPTDTAIQTLDTLFENFRAGSKPLVIGINVGMLGNYSEEGNDEYIKGSIKTFLEGGFPPDEHIYLDFEQYPKFTLGERGHTSKFAKDFMQRLTAPQDNLVRQYYDVELTHARKDRKLCANFDLLSIEEVQDVIIDVLFKARLVKDQFLTARGFLDFIFHLLAGPSYLYDNMFIENDNELVNKITSFDPANLRTKSVDNFILSQSLSLDDAKFSGFQKELTKVGIWKGQKPESYIRLFYLLKNAEFANNYHHSFKTDFDEQLINRYSEVWHLHTGYDGSLEQRSKIRDFYKHTVLSAIHIYNNRNAPYLAKGEFFISEHNGYVIATDIEMKTDIKRIQGHIEDKASHFTAYFKIGDSERGMHININLLNLMQKIVEGYRPNKHDKNAVVILDEIVEEIVEIASNENTLHILKNGKRFKLTNIDDEDYEVSGL